MKARRSNALSEQSQLDQRKPAAAPRLLFESSSPGRSGFSWPEERAASQTIPASFLRDEIADFPELGELEVLRHFTRLSQRNFAIESQFYLLGSCTMKYNPKINEVVARLEGISNAHPFQPAKVAQGCLRILWDLSKAL